MTFNYREVAFILSGLSVNVKTVFQDVLNIDKVSIKDEIDSDKLSDKFGHIRSVDQRFDGLLLFNFYLDQRKKSFRNYLNEKSHVKAKKFVGGASVFYKILTPQEIDFCNENLLYKYREFYGKSR